MDILKVIESRKDELFKILSELIKVDSQSFGAETHEGQIAGVIADMIREIGYTPDVYRPLDVEGLKEHPDYWDGHNLEDRYNVTCVVPGKDHSKRLMLCAHSDTVAIGDLDNWTVDPLGGEIRDGRIWGRGACDDKYGIAAGLFLMKVFKDEGILFPYDLVFTAYCNEEYGGSHGALAACLKYPCDFILNLDAKRRDIINASVGGDEMRLYIRGKEATDSCDSMLDGLQILREEFEVFRQKRIKELSAHEEYVNTEIPETSVTYIEIKAGNGGTDLNRAYAEISLFTSDTEEVINKDFEEMAEALNRRLEPIGMEFEAVKPTTRFFRFAKTKKDSEIISKLKEAGRVVGKELRVCGMCQSDLSIFLTIGSPDSVSFGAGRPFEEYGGAHQADEFIECDEFLEFAKILATYFTM